MKDYRPNGIKMYAATKDIEFSSFEFFEKPIVVKKGDIWLLKQINFNNTVWLNKQYDSESVLQISQDQLDSDFLELNIEEINMERTYKFNDAECTEKIWLNGYLISTETYSWSFEDFCEFMGYHNL